MTRCHLFVALALGFVLLTCARTGYEWTTAGTVTLGIGEETPFTGAVASLTVVGPEGVRLENVAGFAATATELPEALTAAAAVGVGDRIYVAGGSNDIISAGASSCSRDLVAYDVTPGTWAVFDTLPVPIQGHAFVARGDGSLYHVMGYCNGDSVYESRMYGRSATGGGFALVGTFPSESFAVTAVVVDDGNGNELVVAAGGRACGLLHDEVQTLNPTTGAGSILTSRLPSPRCLATSAVVGDTMYVIGGSTNPDCDFPTTYARDPALDEVVAVRLSPAATTVVTHLPEPLIASCAIARPDGTIAIFGGGRYLDGGAGTFDASVSAKVYIFDPETTEVSLYPAELPGPRAGLACAQTRAGQVFIAGGVDATVRATSTFWQFEPYAASGTVTGAVIDAGVAAARWTELRIDDETPAGTTATVAVQVGESPTFAADAIWIDVQPGGPLPADVPHGRYLRWRATLTTTNLAVTPTLRALRIGFESD